MDFVLIYPNRRPFCDPDIAASVAQAAEEAGFYAVLSWDHYILPQTPETLDAWTLLAYMAGKTSSIRLGSCVTPIPFRPPAILAKQVTTVDILSRGRVILGVGAGWNQQEFEGYSQWDEAPVRVSKTQEGMDLIRRLWTEESVDFQGKYYSAKGAVLAPKPVQKPHPPLWVGGRGERMARMAARLGEAWIPTLVTPEEYRQGLQHRQELRQALGIETPLRGAFQHMRALKEISEYHTFVEDYRKAGCEFYGIVWFYPPDEIVAKTRQFGREVITRYRG
ncbi:MAG: LLM class flavin-dependent oxidoreductase [Chloroflexi bacterium]|nr:LLM class flavin-dependent oxidoreductase [Chloroflexota bacterium]